MRNHFISRAACLLLVCLSQPALLLAADGDDDIGLYFDQDELVETSSGYPKPISQVAENVTVITAAEIDRLHAHSVGEVLQQIPGLFLTSRGQDFNSTFLIFTGGVAAERTLVLVDGVRYNNASGGTAELNGLPVGIIKRIEVIKGPVSAVWGSSLGGVVNILTKDAGSTARPQGSLSLSLAEADSRDVTGQLAGKIGAAGYYLYGGHQESDGLWKDRYFDNSPVYGKVKVDLPHGMRLGLTAGYSSAESKTLEFPGADRQDWQINRNLFSTAYFDAPLNNGFALYLAASHFSQDFYWEVDGMGLGDWSVPNGGLLWSDTWAEDTNTFSGRLTWHGKRHSAVFGLEESRRTLDYTADWRYWNTLTVFPEITEERRGIFANATFNFGRLSLSPGLRHDFNSNTEDSLSPSLGGTFQVTDDTLVRGTVARGFNSPNLSMLFGGIGNSDLLPEVIWTYQAGVESIALDNVRLSALVFLHRVEDRWDDSSQSLWVNNGRVERKGFDIEADMALWHHFSVTAKASFVSLDDQEDEDKDMSSANVIFLYDNPSVVTARLAGRYIWWQKDYVSESPKHDTFIWDLSLSRQVYSSPGLTAEVFGVARNLFSGAQYFDIDYQNPDRWLEAGLTVRF